MRNRRSFRRSLPWHNEGVEAEKKSGNSTHGLFSIGHSNHDVSALVQLLHHNQIDIVADVRTFPFSRYSPQFNRETLTRTLRAKGVEYAFLGRELGGRPEGDHFYDDEGHVRYDRLSKSPLFAEGLERLLRDAATHRVAMLCSEGDPAQCHRHLLIARVLDERGVPVTHILSNGTTTAYTTVAHRTPRQFGLFDDEEEHLWRSPLSVSRSTQPSPSSDD